MPWYLFEPEKKPPFVAVEEPDDWRVPATVLLWVCGLGLMLVGVVGWLFFHAGTLGSWSIALSLVATAFAFILSPRSKR